MRRRRATVATPGEWQCGVRRLAVANGPNIFQMLLVFFLALWGHSVNINNNISEAPAVNVKVEALVQQDMTASRASPEWQWM